MKKEKNNNKNCTGKLCATAQAKNQDYVSNGISKSCSMGNMCIKCCTLSHKGCVINNDSNCSSDNEVFKKKYNESQSKLKKCSKRMKKMKVKNEALKDDIDKLNKAMATKTKRFNVKKVKIIARSIFIEDQVRDLKDSIKELRMTIENINDNNSTLIKNIKIINLQKLKLSNCLDSAKKENKYLKGEIEARTKNESNQGKIIEKNVQEVQRFISEIKIKDEENKKSNDMIKDFQDEIDVIKLKKDIVIEELKKIQHEKSKLINKINELEKKNVVLNERCDCYNKMLDVQKKINESNQSSYMDIITKTTDVLKNMQNKSNSSNNNNHLNNMRYFMNMNTIAHRKYVNIKPNLIPLTKDIKKTNNKKKVNGSSEKKDNVRINNKKRPRKKLDPCEDKNKKLKIDHEIDNIIKETQNMSGLCDFDFEKDTNEEIYIDGIHSLSPVCWPNIVNNNPDNFVKNIKLPSDIKDKRELSQK